MKKKIINMKSKQLKWEVTKFTNQLNYEPEIQTIKIASN